MLLKFIRKHTKLLFILILSMMIVPFLFWGVGSIGKQSPDKDKSQKTAAGSISAAELNEARMDSQILFLANFVENNQIRTPEQFEMYKDWLNKIMEQIDMDKFALQQIKLEREAKELGIKATENDLRDWISKFPLFQANGSFNPNRYDMVVTNYFRSWPAMFEKSLSRVLAVKIMQDLIEDSVLVSKKEAFATYKEKNEKVSVYYTEFNSSDFKSKVPEIDEKELRDYYEKHSADFSEPEKIKIAYLLFDPASFVKQVSVSQKDIEDYYEANKDTFRLKDESEDKNKADDKDKAEEKGGAYKPLEEVKDSISETLTKQRSEEACQNFALDMSINLTSEKRLGDMIKLAGEKGMEVKETDYIAANQSFISEIGPASEIMQAAWKMESLSISNILSSDNKWVIISPKDKKPAGIPGFEEVKNKISDILKNEKSKELAKEAAEETLKNLPKNVPFPVAVKSLGLKVKKSEKITKENELYSLTRRIVKTKNGEALVSVRKFFPAAEGQWEKEKSKFEKSYLEEKKRRVIGLWASQTA